MKIKIKLTSDEAEKPEYKTIGSVGADLSTIEKYTINPLEVLLLRTGLIVEIPENFFGMIAPRSSIVLKNHLDMPNSVGIIDSDYRGELLIPLRNLGTKPFTIEKGERIAQLIILPYVKGEFYQTTDLSKTARGVGGFGSTGKI